MKKWIKKVLGIADLELRQQDWIYRCNRDIGLALLQTQEIKVDIEKLRDSFNPEAAKQRELDHIINKLHKEQ